MIRFDQWMIEALYGQQGYYTSPRAIFGARGDFTTSPKTSPLLGKKLAQEITGPVIELGPGDGSLAKTIRDSLGFFRRRKLDYHFVEISPQLQERQKEKFGKNATWHGSLSHALQTTGPEATIISNEFFDAFPVRIFRDRHELYLDSHRKEIWTPVEELPPSTLFEKTWPQGQRLEVHESIHQWLQEELTSWKKGRMITIDYGGTAEEIYHRRPQGTLRAYLHHQRLYPPEAYQNPGHQDLTADICFDDFQSWTHALGLKTNHYQSQATYLGTSEDSADGAFRVLHMERT